METNIIDQDSIFFSTPWPFLQSYFLTAWSSSHSCFLIKQIVKRGEKEEMEEEEGLCSWKSKGSQMLEVTSKCAMAKCVNIYI